MGAFDRIRKVMRFGTTPEAIESSMAVQRMDQSANMGPGRPLSPNQGYSQRPRGFDYPVGVNLATRSRQAYGRTSFDTLRAMIGSYDVARMCINHKIDEIRSMGLLFQAADGVTGDVRDALDAARAVLAFPDREHPFDEWLSLWMENQLSFDAGVLYRRRDLDGNLIGLEVLDGSTIAPFVDEHGRRPSAPAPAYFQLIKGQVWSWYTSEEIVYTRFRPQADSPYGLAPLESILLTANTDMRFQWHLLQMFTDGSVPSGFIEVPPDMSSPDQVAEWQDYYDAVVLGDQAKLHQMIAVPNGTKMTQTRPKGFDAAFPDYLIKRVAAAYGVVPQDLGLLNDVNRSTGETQVDVQFRVNTLPWVRFIESHLNRYLQHDLGLPVKVSLDTGRDKEDRLTEAQAWKVYVETGFASMDEARQELLGLPIDNERPVPRGIITARTGFVPLTSMLAISGPIDGETGAPSDDVPLALTPFNEIGGVMAEKAPGAAEYTRAPLNPDEPMFPDLEHVVPGTDVVNGMPTVGGKITKAITAGGTTAGVTSATGISGDPLEDDELKAELKKFRQFVKTRAKVGKWRDFEFTRVPEVSAEVLNATGRAHLEKGIADDFVDSVLASLAGGPGSMLPTGEVLGSGENPQLDALVDPPGLTVEADMKGRESVPFLVPEHEITVAGLAVKAASTGRVLMLQRALDDDDPAAGKWEFPGGHLEDGESPEAAAIREWSEEVGLGCPDGDVTAAWVYGHYQGFVLAVADEFDLSERDEVANPDGDMFEAVAWWDPDDLPGNPGVRSELADSLDDVLPALDSSFAKASWRDSADKVPQHAFDLKLTDYYTPKVQAAIREFIDSLNVDAASSLVVKSFPDGFPSKVIDALGAGATGSLESVIRQVMVDSFLTGVYGAGVQLGDDSVDVGGSAGVAVASTDWGSWVPGDASASSLVADGGLHDLLNTADITVKGIADSVLDQVGNRIAAGLGDGWSSEKIGRNISDLIGSDSRAMMIAHTEVARAQTAGSMEAYRASGVGTWDLITSDGACIFCLSIAEANPHPVMDTGDTPPEHPWCRCAASPNRDSITANNIRTIDAEE